MDLTEEQIQQKIKHSEHLMNLLNEELENKIDTNIIEKLNQNLAKKEILHQYLIDIEQFKKDFVEETKSETEPMSVKNFADIETINSRQNEATASSHPTTSYPRTNPEQMSYNLGHPPRRAVTIYDQNNPNRRTLGKQMPHEVQILSNEPTILNITRVHPQLFDNYIEQWTALIIRDFESKHPYVNDGEEMIKIAENYLGGTARAAWEAFKLKFPDKLAELAMQGNSIHNFAYQIHTLLTGREANTGLTIRQAEAMRDLEQIQLYDWHKVIDFLIDFLSLACTSGNYFSKDLGERLFSKLPGPLGKEIHDSWNLIPKEELFDNMGTRIQHVISELKTRCTYIQIQRDLKQKNVGFCKNIYTPQQYGRHPDDPTPRRQPAKPKRNYVKRKYIRKSTAKKPYLNKDKHVTKYNPNKNYKKTITCYACQKPGHLSSVCPNRNNLFNEEANLVNTINEDILEITSDISDTSEIWSICSLEGFETKEVEIPEEEDSLNILMDRLNNWNYGM
ncbi:uncharacterized protein LOC116006432 [Ipomoea triloba]|uniref:uncharacterized protein LOC116006432 n=1 Tax=Ipomoea triloba TaxID=35885 RepID=UPI00125E03D2|nr:uncharacterized protein LOC116006432 [Ipomoea triloba]